MLIDEIDYSTFHDLGSNIMEIIDNEGEEINGERVAQTHQALYEKFNGPYAILINRVNSYSHSNDSLVKISEQEYAIAYAIVVYSKASRIAARMHNLFHNNVRIFDGKPAAIKWLRSIMSQYYQESA